MRSGFLNLENGNDRLSRNVRNELPLYAALFPRMVQISSALQRKPEITQNAYELLFGNRIKWSRDHAVGGGLTLRRLMSYIYGAPILDVSRSHTTTQHSR